MSSLTLLSDDLPLPITTVVRTDPYGSETAVMVFDDPEMIDEVFMYLRRTHRFTRRSIFCSYLRECWNRCPYLAIYSDVGTDAAVTVSQDVGVNTVPASLVEVGINTLPASITEVGINTEAQAVMMDASIGPDHLLSTEVFTLALSLVVPNSNSVVQIEAYSELGLRGARKSYRT